MLGLLFKICSEGEVSNAVPDRNQIEHAIYDADGKVIGHVDFKNHGIKAESGHGHKFREAGNPQAGHGGQNDHIPHSDLPSGWGKLPPGVLPVKPIGQ